MTRSRMSADRRRRAAIQGGLRQIAHGERPCYRLSFARDGAWSLDAGFGLTGKAMSRSEAQADARAAVTAMLEVKPEAFDVV